ncbi:MAG: response regulator [Agarilytica sp.]
MTITRALIVDDSRTAQHRLKRLLGRYKLEVDTATSAEEALGYLSYKIPSVIFLDHHMEGMDGLEALKIIKANPNTATIPVIMYTSKSDSEDVFASQAHALGALDTLSKNVMKPSCVDDVLSKLNILPGQDIDVHVSTAENQEPPIQEQNQPATRQNAHPQDTTTRPEPSRVSANEFKAQIARLFELHIADVRTQITENTKFIVRRLAAEIRQQGKQQQEARVNDVPVSVINEETRAENNKIGLVSNSLMGLILFVLVAMSIQMFRSQKHNEKLENDLFQLNQLNLKGNQLLDDVVVSAKETRDNIDTQGLLDALSWALSVDLHFGYNEEPLNARHTLNIQNLTFGLYETGFKGFVELNIQLGNFCVTQENGGAWLLAEDDLPVDQCSFVRNQNLDLTPENYTSVAYLQFEQSAAPVVNGDIEFLINVSNFDNPMYSYPERLSGVTAGEWNRIARQNQQVLVSIDTGN